MPRNRFGGTCFRCGEWVAPGEGHFESPNRGNRKFHPGATWVVQHAECAIRYRGTDAGRNGIPVPRPKGEPNNG